MTKHSEVGQCSMDNDPTTKALLAYLHELDKKSEAQLQVLLQEFHYSMSQVSDDFVNELQNSI